MGRPKLYLTPEEKHEAEKAKKEGGIEEILRL